MRPTVHILSFSYHEGGIPPDERSHGGGFVFDCRCLPNPDRIDEYRPLTGWHGDVVAWLARAPLVEAFLASAEVVVGLALSSYTERGFDSLTVAFGCTGGRHRSVYCAERLRERLSRVGYDTTLEHMATETAALYAALSPPKSQAVSQTSSINRLTPGQG